MKADEVIPGFYWVIPKDKKQPPFIVKIKDIFELFPGEEQRLEVYYHGSDETLRVEELTGLLLGPLMPPIVEKVPEARETMLKWLKEKLDELLRDPTCEVSLSRDLSKLQTEMPEDNTWVLPAKQALVIGVQGGGSPR